MSLFLKMKVANFPKDENIFDWWDDLKNSIRTNTKTFSTNKKKRDRYEMNSLRKEYVHFEKLGKYEEASLIKNQLKILEVKSLKGAQIRSKAQHLEGEKPSKFFLHRELQNNKQKIIKKVFDKNENEVFESEKILNCFKDYYENLYKFEDIDVQVMNDLLCDLPVISEEDKKKIG